MTTIDDGSTTPQERPETAGRDSALVRAAYEKATGNHWNKSDSEAYNENGIKKVPVNKIISVLEAVARRTPAKINSFNYFVKEIVALPDSQSRLEEEAAREDHSKNPG